MRKIKFRAWDKVTPKMCKVRELLLSSERAFISWYKDQTNQGSYTIPLDDIILLQYTGLKDKNGKEIYEGDIVRARYVGLDQTYKNVAITIDPRNPTRGYWEDCEVIGNVWENPELLEDKC